MTEKKQTEAQINLPEVIKRLEGAKGHFLTGQREILTAIREVIKVLADLSGEAPEAIGGIPVYLFEVSAAMIDYFISHMPGPPPDEIIAARKEALQQLIELIDKEAERTGRFAASDRDVLKVEAMMALKKFLEHELEHDPHAPKPRVTKVEIE